ncbi:type II secretion system protein G [Sedimentisphaera cyanobacteriorum]|uniref:Type II secretion system protein G n=1 Tax=Sedimentisphaera cyanobacteriorum TaxID=1940790 RepID=A0A1Q2HQD4_9BACT|nr:type II secretion system protein [Sedimentisphaera cyanobacteriorum]AQQ09445.1 type II secretion system protein G [Sedimentisphaera cyanobacteriorum]
MKKINKSKAFTLVELLTVISIIAVLLVLLIPALNQVANVGQKVRQTSQLTTIAVALETFNNDFGQYPDSDNTDSDGNAYYGSQKLSEALLGYDMLGLHPDALPQFDADDDNNLYADDDGNVLNLDSRSGPYIEPDKINPVESGHTQDALDLAAGGYYIADVFKRDSAEYGMPVLYYRANTNNKLQTAAGASSVYDVSDSNVPFDTDNSDYSQFFNGLERPWEDPDGALTDQEVFNQYIKNESISSADDSKIVPYRPQSFLLITAGKDGKFGTEDDITNFSQNQ